MVIEIAAAADRSLPRPVIEAAVDAAAPARLAMSRLAAALAADPGALIAGAPPLAGRLAAELTVRGSTALTLPACAVCGRAGKPLSRTAAGGVCQRCRAWQLAAACTACGKVKPVAGRDAAGEPVCEVCRRRGPARHRACGICGKTAPVAVRGRDGKPDICVNCYRLPAAACSACGRIRPCTFAATSQPVCKQCAPRATAACARCGQQRPPQARWPEGPVCDTCYTAALRRRVRCACLRPDAAASQPARPSRRHLRQLRRPARHQRLRRLRHRGQDVRDAPVRAVQPAAPRRDAPIGRDRAMSRTSWPECSRRSARHEPPRPR